MAKKTSLQMELDKEKRENVEDSILSLKSEINNMMSNIQGPETLDDMLNSEEFLPDLEVEISTHDYEKDMNMTKLEAKETLKCLANLYLNETNMESKNIYNIIKNDANKLAELNFTISCAKRALIQCMGQIDCGNNDPEMYKSIALFQKEMRDTVKMAYELQKKMKDFYKELKTELPDLNNKEDIVEEEEEKDDIKIIMDTKELNDWVETLNKKKES